MLEVLADKEEWIQFLERKEAAGHLGKREGAELRRFIENEEFRGVAERMISGEAMPFPRVRIISKMSTGKKRTVFLFPREENYALKLLAAQLHKYDGIFANNLYSFRRSTGVYRAVQRLLRFRSLHRYFVYKVDIHDYFNSIEVPRLLGQLREIMKEDPALYGFFDGILSNPYAMVDGEPREIKKGVMAGVPVAPFLANVYLMEMDHWFAEHRVLYARYSDDIIVFAKTREELDGYVRRIHETLQERGLEINPRKESYADPGEPFTFLGFQFADGALDVAPASVQKLKDKMRRKARALIRWRIRKGLDGDKAARAFIRHFNRKLYESTREDDLTWARWYFPVLTTDRSLHIIDEYMQDCIRYTAAGNHGKKRYNLRYGTMKEWGYRPLVNAYYSEEYREEHRKKS